jgi:hypothetical protein
MTYSMPLYVLSNLFILIAEFVMGFVIYLFIYYTLMFCWNTKIANSMWISSYLKTLKKFCYIILHIWVYSYCYFYLLVIDRVTEQETLHKHKDLDRAVEMVEGSITQESTKPPKKSLLKNWPLMSSIITYCVFSLHYTAYVEVPFSHLIGSAVLPHWNKMVLKFMFCNSTSDIFPMDSK